MDKQSPSPSSTSTVVESIMPLIEEETSKNYYEIYLRTNMDCSWINWIFTSNTISQFPQAFLDRIVLLNARQPTLEQIELSLNEMVQGWTRGMPISNKLREGLLQRFKETKSLRVLKETAKQHARQMFWQAPGPSLVINQEKIDTWKKSLHTPNVLKDQNPPAQQELAKKEEIILLVSPEDIASFPDEKTPETWFYANTTISRDLVNNVVHETIDLPDKSSSIPDLMAFLEQTKNTKIFVWNQERRQQLRTLNERTEYHIVQTENCMKFLGSDPQSLTLYEIGYNGATRLEKDLKKDPALVASEWMSAIIDFALAAEYHSKSFD